MMHNFRYNKLSTDELINLSQKDDLNALEELIKRIQKNVFTAFSYLVKKNENVYDLTQEALLRIAKNIHTLKNPKSFNSWVNQIITNLYYDNLRKNKKVPDLISLEDNLPIPTSDIEYKPLEKCISCETETYIKQAIQDLPEYFKIVIILRELQGLSYEKIAEITNTSIGTVKSRIARARNKLQCCLKSYI